MPDPRPAPLHLIRPEVRAERAYRVPTDAEAAAKLDQNESPFDLPEALKRTLVEGFAATEWNRYPDDRPHRLIAALAERLGLPTESVIVGRGSNELTHTVGLCLLGRGTPVVLPHPMFALFASVARMHAAEIVGVAPEADLSHDAEAILAAARRADAALTIVTSPNNPTGRVIPFEGLEALAAGAPGFVLFDEAYHEFVEGPTAADLLRRHPNVLVMRTFSKAMGLAGLRLGLLLGAPEVIQEIEKARLPFLVDRLSERAALEVLAHPEWVAERVATLKAERARMERAASAMEGVEVIPGAANFFLMRTPLAPADLVGGLAARSVRVRDVSAYPGLGGDGAAPGWVRVSVGAPAENRAFEVALQHVLSAAGVPAG
ncbi:MAG TPA: aminotransferase class I/II-fold pyridoxal phosphate-dependent enzyme [Rubricoccaceae bacterium]|nr:aminotransferase class I/II-fold pyridoxal phosphate-dependent enzyme [Rubricoccaceae bacterium]